MVYQLVGIELVPRYVMKAIGLEGTMGCTELLLYHLWLFINYFNLYDIINLIDIIDIINSKKIIDIIVVT